MKSFTAEGCPGERIVPYATRFPYGEAPYERGDEITILKSLKIFLLPDLTEDFYVIPSPEV